MEQDYDKKNLIKFTCILNISAYLFHFKPFTNKKSYTFSRLSLTRDEIFGIKYRNLYIVNSRFALIYDKKTDSI